MTYKGIMFTQDLDIFDEELTPAETTAPGQADSQNFLDIEDETIQGDGSDVENTEEAQKDTTEEKDVSESDTNESTNDENKEVTTDAPTEEDTEEFTPEMMKKMIDEINAKTEEISDTVEDLEDAMDQSGNTKAQGQLNNLKSQLLEMQDKVAELEFQNSSLKRQAETANSKLLDKIGETEWLELNRGILDTLDSEPELKLLVKYYKNDDESSKKRVEGLVKGLYEKLTGQNIDDIMKGNDKGNLNTALMDVGE